MATILELNGAAVRALVSEENSSKYAIDAHNRNIERIVDMSEVPRLKTLDVSFNKLKKLENLEVLKDLKELKAYNNQLSKLSGVNCNTELENLFLSHNNIKKICDDLSQLRQLHHLRLDGNCISSVENMSNLKRLQHLNLSRNRLQGACSSGLEGLVSLVTLNLSDNNLSSFGNLKSMRRLEEINVSTNQLTSLDGLHGLHSLGVINAGSNRIQDIKSLPALKNLTEFYIDHNPLISIKELARKTPKLEILDARNCRIRGLKDIEPLRDLKDMEDIWLAGNPCALSEEYHQAICNALPHIQTLDNYTRALIFERPESMKARSPVAGTRPGTAGRARTPLLRPVTPSLENVRPGTAEGGRPLIYQPSARAGNQVKMMSPSEVAQEFEKLRSQLSSVRKSINNLGKIPDNNYQPDSVADSDKCREKHSVGTDPLVSGSIFSFSGISDPLLQKKEATPELDLDSLMKQELKRNLISNMSDESPRVKRTPSAGSSRNKGYQRFRITAKVKRYLDNPQ